MFAQAMKDLRSDRSVCMSPSYAMMPTWKRDNVRLGRCPEEWLSPLPHPNNLTCPRYIHILKLKLAHTPLFSICLCACVCVFSKHTPESSGVISEPSSPLPSFSATKYRLLDHLREWFCSLNITISTFSCPTETTPPNPISYSSKLNLRLLLLPSWHHQPPPPPPHHPEPLEDLPSECRVGFALLWTWVRPYVWGQRHCGNCKLVLEITRFAPRVSSCLFDIYSSFSSQGLQPSTGEWLCIASVCFVETNRPRH